MKMNKLSFIKRFTFAVLSLLITANLWGQDPAPADLSGSGTENDPYQITSVDDWNAFADAVNGGYDYSGKYVQLEADVPSEEEIYEGTSAVTKMVGVWDATEANRKPFKGTFKGNGKTLIVNYTSDGNYTAPFRCTNGALITNDLTILGNINATNGYAAGVVGGNYGNKTKINSNVTVRVNITGGGTYCGGVAVDATYLEMSSCLYNGQIIAGDYSGGFCAKGDANTKFNKCIFDAATGSSITGTHTGNFINGTYNTTNSNNYYYTYEAPTASTTQEDCIYTSYGDIPNDGKFRMLTNLAGNDYYYVEGTCVISGIDSLYYQNNAQHGGITYDLMFNLSGDPAIVIDPECYTAAVLNGSGVAVNVSTIAAGTYTLRITGKEGCCSGSVTSESFIVKETIFDKGTGTKNDPYQIRSITDWSIFAKAVNDGHSFLGEYLELTDDITVTVKKLGTDTIVGVMTSNEVESKWFSGTFDGGWHTLTFNVGTSTNAITPSHSKSPSAPFRVIDGATIKNLTVDGTIYSTKKYNAGFVGFAYNTKTSNVNNIINCTSSIVIKCHDITANDSDCSVAGFVAENKQGSTKFNNCIFIGSLEKDDNTSAQKCGGFVSYNNGSKLYFTNCTMAGTIDLSNTGTFYRASKANHEYSNCYYITNYGGHMDATNCKQAYTNPSHADLTNKIYKHYYINSKYYYIPNAEISGFKTTTYSAGGTITIPAPTVTYYGRTLTRGTDYVIKKKIGEGDYATVVGDITLSDAGDYYIKIEATGSNYGGSQTTTIKVVEFNSWAVVQEYLADASKGDRVITLSSNITPALGTDHYLEVNGNVVLNLNGHTIDRALAEKTVFGQVIRVSAGANLTINGSGTIKGGFHYPGTDPIPESQDEYYDKRDGGGIHNMGTLVMNNVTVESNQCEKEAEGSGSYSARGGGIYTGENSSFMMNGGSLYGNTCEGGGGGVFGYKASQFEMNDVIFDSNQSGSKGGGLRLQGGKGAASLDNCTFEYNMAIVNDASQGGGIYVDGTALNLTNCTINGNSSTLQGSGLFMMGDCNINAKNCTFSMNGAAGSNPNNNGGAIYISKGTFIMDGGSIAENSCNGEGGGIYIVKGATLKLKGNVNITNNHHGTTAGNRVSNVYIADHTVSGKIIIEDGFDGANSKVGVTKRYASGFNGVFTENLNSNGGSIANFTSDDDGYKIVLSAGEAAIDNPIEWGGAGWPPTGVTVDDDNYTISIPVSVITGDLTANSITLEGDGCLIVENGAVLTVPTITNSDPFRLLIEEGGQVITNSAVDATVVKNIGGSYYGRKNYLISSAVSEPTIYSTNMITINGFGDPSYDLYRYNEAAGLQWENYRNTAHDDFTTLQNGRGYLYLNVDDILIEIEGKLNVSSINYTLSCSGSELTGFNIIGNPYSHNVYKGAAGSAIPNGDLLESKYYMLNPTTGKWDLTNDGTVIPPLTGILVQATKAGTLTMTNSTSGASGAKDAEKKNDNIWFTISNNDYEDRACVEFKEGHGLNKIEHLNEEAPMLYIHHNGEDFASVDMSDNTKQFNLNLEAKTTGNYTLSVEPQGAYKYLHLIDRLAEKDIDLLAEKEYSFIGSSADNAERFIVRLEHSDNVDSSVFAYQSGNEIVVSGEGELQIFDVMGRLVMQKHVSGVEAVDKPMTTGVYVLRLNENSQKIVVR